MNQRLMPATLVVAAVVGIGATLIGQQPPPQAASGAPDAVAALKTTVQQGLALARKYEWVETTAISLKGEEKARTQKRCYYGADGKVQKISLDQPAAAAPPQQGGRRGGKLKGKIVENKKDDMKEYMEKAAALIHQYVPPNPKQIDAAKAAGRVAAKPQADGSVQIAITQYLLAGDTLTVGFNPKTSRLLGLNVNTYLDKPEDTVTLAVQMATLADGALYAGQVTLEAKAKNIKVVIQNTGHRPVQQ